MSPFDPDPNWYEKTWYSADKPKRARRYIAPLLVGIGCLMLAFASVTVLQPAPSDGATTQIG